MNILKNGGIFLKRDFVLTKQDYIDFNLFFYAVNPQMKRKRLIQTIIFPIIYLLIPVMLHIYKQTPYSQTLPIFVIAAIAWIIIYPKLSKWAVKKNVAKVIENSEKNGGNLTGDYSIEEKETGIEISNEVGKIFIEWNQILKLEEDDERIYIFINPATAYIVKKNAFLSKDEEEALKNRISSKAAK